MTNVQKIAHPDSDASIEVWMEYVLSCHSIDEIDLGLDRIHQVALKMNLLQHPQARCITVAGTNGKGSTCAVLESVLIEAGYRVGLYTSPHIHHFCERIRLQKEKVRGGQFSEALYRVARAKGEVKLTFFEWTTLAALWVFHQHPLDFILLEVGLGGRLDATNVIDPDLSILTSIALDHVDFLGTTREAIGFEKAGIMRARTPAICGDSMTPDSVLQHARELDVSLQLRHRDFDLQEKSSSWMYQGQKWTLLDLPKPNVLLDNAATAFAALEVLVPECSSETLKTGLQKISLPGRLEWCAQNPSILLDVAHNVAAVEVLKQTIEKHRPLGQVHAVFGVMKDKPVMDMLTCLETTFDTWTMVNLPQERAAKMQCYLDVFPEGKAKVLHSMEAALNRLEQEITQRDLIVVFGSFHAVSEFKKIRELRSNECLNLFKIG